MCNREKVIKAIETCIGDGHCSRCGYHLSDYHAMAHDCRDQMMEDALALLKEHENESKRNPVIVCPHCGKRVK